MLAGVVDAPNHLVTKEVPEPVIGDYDALVRIAACSFCNGTDIKLIEGRFSGVNVYPFILGHESVGEVVEIGDRVKNYGTGDWVLRPSAVYPEHFAGRLASFWGGFAEFGVVTDYVTQARERPRTPPLSAFHRMQQILPRDVDPTKATTYITLKETLSWLHKVGLEASQSVLVVGSGPVGLSFATCARILGAHPVIMTGLRDERLAVAHKFGVDYTINTTKEDFIRKVKEYTEGRGADLAIEAVGDYSLISDAAKALAPNGEVGTYGVPPADASTLRLDLSGLPGDWTLRFTSPDEPSAHDEVLDLFKRGQLRADHFVTHVYPLKETIKGLEAIKRKEALKVVITM